MTTQVALHKRVIEMSRRYADHDERWQLDFLLSKACRCTSSETKKKFMAKFFALAARILERTQPKGYRPPTVLEGTN